MKLIIEEYTVAYLVEYVINLLGAVIVHRVTNITSGAVIELRPFQGRTPAIKEYVDLVLKAHLRYKAGDNILRKV